MKILIVDDNERFLRIVQASLEQVGYQVSCATDGQEGLRLASEQHPDLIILDIVMPEMNGWEVCRQLRFTSNVPIIFLTAYGSEPNVIRGFNYGADDFMTKPVSLAQLKAHVQAALRRANDYLSPEHSATYDDGVLYIDLQRNLVQKRGQAVALSLRQFQLLACLVRRAGQVVPYADLLREAWGAGYENELAYLTVYTRHIRQKIEDDPSNPRYIHTRLREGYCFCPEEPLISNHDEYEE